MYYYFQIFLKLVDGVIPECSPTRLKKRHNLNRAFYRRNFSFFNLCSWFTGLISGEHDTFSVHYNWVQLEPIPKLERFQFFSKKTLSKIRLLNIAWKVYKIKFSIWLFWSAWEQIFEIFLHKPRKIIFDAKAFY